MADKVLVELIEDVNTVDADGDEVPLWAAGQQVWLDPISAHSFVETRKIATVVVEDKPADADPVDAPAKFEAVDRAKKVPAAPPADPAAGAV